MQSNILHANNIVLNHQPVILYTESHIFQHDTYAYAYITQGFF